MKVFKKMKGKRDGRSLKACRHLLQYWGTQRSQHAVYLEMCLEGVKVETHSSAIKVNGPVSVCQCER